MSEKKIYSVLFDDRLEERPKDGAPANFNHPKTPHLSSPKKVSLPTDEKDYYDGLVPGKIYAVSDGGTIPFRDVRCHFTGGNCRENCELFGDGRCKYRDSLLGDTYRKIDNALLFDKQPTPMEKCGVRVVEELASQCLTTSASPPPIEFLVDEELAKLVSFPKKGLIKEVNNESKQTSQK